MIDYILYSVISVGCSFLIYLAILKNQKTFNFNRFFLLTSLILSLIAPLMEIESIVAIPRLNDYNLQSSDTVINDPELINGVTVSTFQRPRHTLISVFWFLYILISLFLTFRFAKNLLNITKLTTQPNHRDGNLKIIEIDHQESTSSFFNYIFISSQMLKDSNYSKPIIEHERIHSRLYHTLDLIFIELLLCAFWFNPFIWLYRKAIIQNHEFTADDQTIKSGIDMENYSKIMISSGNLEHRVALASGFNFNQIKQRIIMLHQSESSNLKRSLKIVAAMLLSAGIFVFSSFKNSKEPLVVVIDAAHGGHDSGSLNEKDIVLSISQHLSQLSTENVKIIAIRHNDQFMGLQKRINLINEQKPDLTLSIHCNVHQDASVNGVEAFFYSKSKHKKESRDYGRILIENQVDLFFDEGKVKQAEFFMLKNIEGPMVLLELGFLSNSKDRVTLNNSSQQKAIAKNIFNSLKQIRDLK